MTLTEHVYSYYTQHFTDLTADKRFHFASRMAAWSDDDFSKNYLESVQSHYAGSNDQVREALHTLLINPPQAKINAAQTRQPYFDAYPSLRGRMLALFRVRHLLTIYGEDHRETLLALVSKKELYALSDALKADEDALKVLSTYAINYIYLVEVILFPRGQALALERILTIGCRYATVEPEEIQLLIYFYTHCIIGASNFYAQRIPEVEAREYQTMLSELETLLSERFDDINLDNKLEFLVCCRIVEFTSKLDDRIYSECEKSLSPEGNFVIDTHNRFKQSQKTSFQDSEHRNVLLIMSASAYSPLS